MFDRILDLFRSPPKAPEPLPEPDARMALGALLVRVAKADRAYLFEEIEQIDRIFAEIGGMNPVEAAKYRAMCERLEEQMPRSEDATAILRDATTEDQRRSTIEAMWRVSLADGLSHEAEQALVAMVEEDLGISPEEGVALRERAKAQLER